MAKLKRTLVTSFITVTKVSKTNKVNETVSSDAQSKASSPVCDHVAQVTSADNTVENPCVSEDLHTTEVGTSSETIDCHDEKTKNQGSDAALPID